MRATVKQKLEARRRGVTLPVDPRAFCEMPVGQVPDTDERAVLILSSAYQWAEDPDRAAVSWPNQEKAAAFFNAHGLARTLDEIVRVAGPAFLER